MNVERINIEEAMKKKDEGHFLKVSAQHEVPLYNLATNNEEMIKEETFKTVYAADRFQLDFNPTLVLKEEKISSSLLPQQDSNMYDSLGSKSMLEQAEPILGKNANLGMPQGLVNPQINTHEYRRSCLRFISEKSDEQGLTDSDVAEIKILVEEAKNNLSDLSSACYYAKCVARAGKIVSLHAWLITCKVTEIFDRLLEAFEYVRILLVNVLSALSNLSYQEPEFAKEILGCKFWPGAKNMIKISTDKNTMRYFASLVTNMTYRNDYVKLQLVEDGIAQLLEPELKIACRLKFIVP